MIVGICGAHRTGKTTLCRAYAERDEIFTFAQTSTSAIIQEMGIDPAADLDLATRLAVQEEVLARYEAMLPEFLRSNVATIIDRTPLDFMAYTFANVRQTDTCPELHARLESYKSRCYDVLNRYFSVLVLVQPGIEVVPEQGKAVGTFGYIEHIHLLCHGLMADRQLKVYSVALARNAIDLQDRVKAIDKIILNFEDRTFAGFKESVEKGVSIH